MNDVSVTIIIAVISSGAFGVIFAFIQFMISRKDKKQEQLQERLDKRDARFEGLRKEFHDTMELTTNDWKVSRCDKHLELIEKNTKAINELLEITKEQSKNYDAVVKNLDEMTKYSKIMGEGVKSVLYDKIIIITDKCLSRCAGGAITAEEKANVEQLYLSYSGLNGNGEGKIRYHLAMEEMKNVTKEEAEQMDLERNTKLA